MQFNKKVRKNPTFYLFLLKKPYSNAETMSGEIGYILEKH